MSCLKKRLGSTTHIQIELPMLDDEGKIVLEPECILEIKTKTLRSRSVNEYLIKWRNLLDDETTCENDDFDSCHSSLPILLGECIPRRDDL